MTPRSRRNVQRAAGEQAGDVSINTLIQAASDEADPAAGRQLTVTIPAGTYAERLRLDRPVLLTAAGGPGSVVVTVDQGIAVTIRTDAVLRGIVVRSTDATAPAVLAEAGTAVLEQCEIHGSGVEADHDAVLTLQDCAVRRAARTGVRAREESRVHLRDCLIERPGGDGLWAEGRARTLVVRTTVLGPAGTGCRIAGNAQAELADSWIVAARREPGGGNETGGDGLAVADEGAVRMRSCRVIDCAGAGVRVEGTSRLGRRLPFDAPTPLDEAMADRYGPSQGARGVTLTDCVVDGSGAEGIVADGGQTRLERTRVTGSQGVGVAARGTARLELADCAIDGGTTGLTAGGRAQVRATGLTVRRGGGHGLLVTGDALLQLTGGEIEHCGRDGIRIDGHGDAVIRDSRVAACRNGVVLASAHHPVLERCRIEQVERNGVTIARGAIALLHDCEVTGAGSHGIHADHRATAFLDGCRVTDTGEDAFVAWGDAQLRGAGPTPEPTHEQPRKPAHEREEEHVDTP
jgi:nitrous oxidase accessory protein NosD